MVTLEQRAEDVGAVMDAAQSEQAAFLGWGDGGGIGAMFAATNPQRISALVLSAMAFITTPAAGHRRPGPDAAPVGHDRAGGGNGHMLDSRGAGARGRSPAADVVAPVGTAVGDPERRGHAAAGGEPRPTCGPCSRACRPPRCFWSARTPT